MKRFLICAILIGSTCGVHAQESVRDQELVDKVLSDERLPDKEAFEVMSAFADCSGFYSGEVVRLTEKEAPPMIVMGMGMMSRHVRWVASTFWERYSATPSVAVDKVKDKSEARYKTLADAGTGAGSDFELKFDSCASLAALEAKTREQKRKGR